ncbi:S-adenosyl-L-methionine-dependent methyltransferase [Sporodiniella umbellata]|nr:S-adenosyl-L-methionine-dependent methyltransferase [Sporodiniella umbellata]
MTFGRRKKNANKVPVKKAEGEKQKYFDERKPFAVIERDNEKFTRYYKAQNILSEEEFSEFYEFIKTILPTTFRITASRATALAIKDVVEKTYVPKLQNVLIDGVKIEPPKPLPFYPEGFAWQLNAPRLVVKKSPELKEFHRFIVTETEAGNMSRQEAVSMVPPLLMDIKPHQWVLDMCAAPGSKTGQIIEAIHSNDKLNEMPTGLVVANDADYKRSHMLIHQSKRLQSPCFMATNHDGAQFPNIRLNETSTTWQFDRVLCDVPCSGDGTIRKNEKIWDSWSPAAALQLHSTQVQIFARGCQLLKMGGRIVYSTCSFNPVENEAVVAEVLRQTKHAIRLVDVSNELVELKRKPGLSTWKVADKDTQFVDRIEDVREELRRKFPTTVFPPTAEEAAEMHLERCLRIYPHQQNTGGFFVAVFEKVAPMTAADRISLLKAEGKPIPSHVTEEEEKKVEEIPVKRSSETEEESNVKKAKTEEEGEEELKLFSGKPKRDVFGIKEAPFEMMSSDCEDLKEITAFYGLDPAFPRDQFLLRSENNAKGRSLYFVSRSIKKVLESKEFSRLNTVNTGVRLFVRQSSLLEEGSPFRLSSEGLPLLDSALSERRRFTINLEELRVLLTEAFPLINNFPSEASQTKLSAITPGCCIGVLDEAGCQEVGFVGNLILPVWKGKTSLNVLLNKKDKRSLCERLFNVIPEITPEHLTIKSTERQAAKEAQNVKESKEAQA